MRLLCVLLLLLGTPALVRADAAAQLKEARQRWLKGNYEEARAAYEALLKDPAHAAPAALGVSRTWESQGEYAKALAGIEAALKGQAENPDLLARRADLLYQQGRWDEAVQDAARALAAKPDHFVARWVQAQVYRDKGEFKKADAEFRWFVRTYTERSEKDVEIKDPDELLIVGLAGAENARWNNLADQFPFILNTVYADALAADKDFWPAEYHAGMLLLEKYNRAEALKAFTKALTINPSSAEAHVGKGLAALQKLDLKEVEEAAETALSINPNLPDARRLRADLHFAAGDFRAARADLERARKVNPRDEQTLGRLAACAVLQKLPDQFTELQQEAAKHNAKPGLFYFILAEQLEERRRFNDAEQYYKKAAELRPMVPWAKNGLGMLYMRLGREDDARKVLAEAFEADAFNIRVSNTLKVLRHLEKYETIKTAHFELRYDPKNDPQLARFMARYLEEIYEELANQFDYRPQGPFLVEVFNNHDMFSGRVVALPDLHTIGACTGRIFAMVSPHGKGIDKRFNWNRVLRHEMVHIFNLDQTNFQLPHWFTEGLAVRNEGFPWPQQWYPLLTERLASQKAKEAKGEKNPGDLLNLDTIDLGFMRPRSPDQWHLAYCQSNLYVDYLSKTYGDRAVGGMLAAYRDGQDTAQALKSVCKVDKAEFEKGYRAYLENLVQTLKGRPAEKAMSYSQLERAHEENPDDPNLAARLAEQYLVRRRTPQARKLVEGVLAKDVKHPLASYVKARLLLAAGEDAEAKKLLEAALDRNRPEPKVLSALGNVYYEAKDFGKAAEIYELGHKAQPYDSKWLMELLRIHNQSGDKDRQVEVLKKLVPMDADELGQRKKLAKLLLEAGKHAEAEKYARQGLEIDILDEEVQEMFKNALLGQNKEKEAEEWKKIVGK